MSIGLFILLAFFVVIISASGGFIICSFLVSGRMTDLEVENHFYKKEINRLQEHIDCQPQPIVQPLRFTDIETAQEEENYTQEEREKALEEIMKLFTDVSEEETQKASTEGRI
jgi:hypothetical protein